MLKEVFKDKNWIRKDILWSVENKYLSFDTDGIHWIHHNHKYQIAMMKHESGSVMVISHAMVCAQSMGFLKWIQDMDSDARISWRTPCNYRHWSKTSLQAHPGLVKPPSCEPFDLSSQSTDFNITMGIWAELDLIDKNAKNSNEKFAQLQQEWNKVPICFIHTA
ncbi:hypothetical protein Trydic_g18938 [Trypoxylus dichotomus]